VTLLRERLVDAAVSIVIGALLYLVADPVLRWLVEIIVRRDLRANP
jgi:hypothetical protein